MIAALPMYDRAETKAANDRLWAYVRAHLEYGPPKLTRNGNVWDMWQSPDLALAQTCGYPYRARLHGRVTLIGTPDYGLMGCPPGHYNSVFVVRKGDDTSLSSYANARFAYNEAMSQSGWAAPQIHAQAQGFSFRNLVQSGAHRESARAVRAGRADIAALDALSWDMMQRYDPFTTDLRVIDRTQPTPALPFIAAITADRSRVFSALEVAIRDLSDADRETLHLQSLLHIPATAYLAVPNPAAPGET